MRTWLYRIAINHCQNLCRAWHGRHVFSNVDDAVWENAVAQTDSPLRVLETKELGQRIQKALDGLSDEYRLLLLLVADAELSYQPVWRARRTIPRCGAREIRIAPAKPLPLCLRKPPEAEL